MCGIVGVYGRIFNKEEAIFKDMLQMDVVRGPHSTGIVAVKKDGGWSANKAPILPSDLFQLRQTRETMKGDNKILIGHNRYATVGDVNTANAHPFWHDGLVGVHNGTLRNWRRQLDNSQNFDVDSDCLLWNLNEYGADDTIPDVEGAYALVWYDRDSKTFSVIRNKDRPLFYGMSPDNKTMYYASEHWMIKAAVERNGEKVQEIKPFPAHTLHEFALPEGYGKALPKARCRIVEGFTPPPPAQTYIGHQSNGQSQQSHSPTSSNLRYRNAECEAQAKELRDLKGKTVFFAIDQYIQTTNGKNPSGYVEGLRYGGNEEVIRFYCNEADGMQWEAANSHDFKATVVGHTEPFMTWAKGENRMIEGSLIVDPKTIEIAPDDVLVKPTVDDDADTPPESVYDDDIGNDRTDDGAQGQVIPIRPPTGPDGNAVTEKQWDELTKEGCAQCQCNLFYGDAVEWLHDKAVLCEDCSNELRDQMQKGATVQ